MWQLILLFELFVRESIRVSKSVTFWGLTDYCTLPMSDIAVTETSVLLWSHANMLCCRRGALCFTVFKFWWSKFWFFKAADGLLLNNFLRE